MSEQLLSKSQAVENIRTALSEIEAAIESHPPPIVAHYKRARAAYLEGIAQGRAGWAPVAGLTREQFELVLTFIFAAAFVSAWWATQNNRAKRDEASNTYALLASTVGLDSDMIFATLLKTEQRHIEGIRSLGATQPAGCLGIVVLGFALLGLAAP